MKKLVIGAFAALTLAAVGGAVAPTASATDPVVVSILLCDINGGTTTVPAGVPISLRNVGESAGTYGLLKDFLLKQTSTDTIVRNGVTTVVDLTNTWSDPQQFDKHFWLTRPPNTELGTLSSGESVLVTSTQVFSQPVLYTVQPVGPDDHPAFLDDDTVSCLITAA